MYVLPLEKQKTVIAALCEGSSIRGTARIVNSHRDTVMRLGLAVGEGYARLHDKLFLKLHSNYIEVDEAWSFVMKKQKRVLRSDPPEYGDQYSYIAMDADRKAIISYLVGKRTTDTTVSFALDLRGRVLGHPQITSDGYPPYVMAVDIAFGMTADYAMLVKHYDAECTVEAARRYSPNEVTSVDKKIVFGHPDLAHISTSYVERQNLTLRMLTRRFTRLTNGFSKVLRNHAAAMDLYVGWYNLCRKHETLGGITPAMAMGVTDHVWEQGEFIGECLALTDARHPPVRFGEQRWAEVVSLWQAPARQRGEPDDDAPKSNPIRNKRAAA